MYRAPSHQYTKALIASRLSMDPSRRTAAPPITGDPPSPINPPPGCRFAARCAIAETLCRTKTPELTSTVGDPSHWAGCSPTMPGTRTLEGAIRIAGRKAAMKTATDAERLLDVRGLSVRFFGDERIVTAVDRQLCVVAWRNVVPAR